MCEGGIAGLSQLNHRGKEEGELTLRQHGEWQEEHGRLVMGRVSQSSLEPG